MSRDNYKDRVFTSRAVSPDVAEERGYRRYAAGDRAAVLDVDERLDARPVWLRQVLKAPGWAIPKFPVMPNHPEFGWRPYAQLRPDWPVMPKWHGHDHGGMLHRGKDDPKLQRRRGRNKGRCYCGLVHEQPPIRRSIWPPPAPKPGESFWDAYARSFDVSREWYQTPIPDRREHEASVCEWADVPDDMKVKVGLWRDGRLIEDDRERVLVPTGHLHPDTGELVVPVDRPHAHLDWAKYVYVKGRGKAQRLGTHQRVRDKWHYAAPEGLFIFVIEGTLKLDSVVSAGWPGIEAGSVTLWDAEVWDELALPPPDEEDDGGYVRHVRELEEFARLHLQGVPTAVVCDSDWAENWLVRQQVNAAVGILANCGVPAVGCAPPPGDELGWNDPLTDYPKRAKNGVDDWLASFAGGDRHEAMLRLIVREDGTDDAPGLEAAVERASRRVDGRETARALLRDLGRRATDSGVVSYKERAIAASIRRGTTTVQTHRKRLEETGALTEIAKVEYRSKDDGGVQALPPRMLLRPDLLPPANKRTLRDWLDEPR